jgi:hypothetical protein
MHRAERIDYLYSVEELEGFVAGQRKLVQEKRDFFLDRDSQESQGRLPEKGE